MKDSLAPSLSDAELVFCYTNGIGWDAQGALSSLGAKAACFDDLGQLVDAVAAAAHPTDHVLVMSNGGFGGVHLKLLAALFELSHMLGVVKHRLQLVLPKVNRANRRQCRRWYYAVDFDALAAG
jgi:hypothetical protein